MEAGRVFSFWTRLPPELRRMVLRVVIRTAQQEGRSLTPYATVCPEWQAAFEAITFRSLKLTPARLEIPGVVDMVNRRGKLGFVRYIGLFIPIADYYCPQCHDFRSEDLETRAEFEDDMATIQDGLQAIFRLLSKWKRKGDLSLDITVQSPSDSRHHFRHIDVDGNSDSQPTTSAIDDWRHGWHNGMRTEWAPRGAYNRLFMDIALSPEFWGTLPQVTAVTGLCLRRQTTRRWGPGAVRQLVKHLNGLQELHYEPWREWDIRRRMVTDTNTQHTLLESLRHTASDLTRLVLFEDFSEAYIHSFVVFSIHGAPPWPWFEDVRTPSRHVTSELAWASARLPHLEHLSAAFLVDAEHFFPAVRMGKPRQLEQAHIAHPDLPAPGASA